MGVFGNTFGRLYNYSTTTPPVIPPEVNTIYIDQTNVGTGRDGTVENPYNSFSEFTFTDDYTYKIKGTYTSSTPISLTNKSNVYIISYGGTLATFSYTGTGYACILSGGTNNSIYLDIDGNGTSRYGVQLSSGTGHIIAGKIHGFYNGTADGGMAVYGGGTNHSIVNCEIYDCGCDGMYLVNTTNLLISECYIHHVNQNYGNSNALGTGASGDGIQLDGLWSGYAIKNTIIDRSDADTGNKFCLILNSANNTNNASSGIVEGCTFITKSAVTTALYIAQGNGSIIRYNTFKGVTGGIRISNYSYPAGVYTNTCKNTLIHNNIFYDCSYGVGVAYGDATDIRNTKVYNNVFYNIPMHIYVDRTFVDSRNNIHLRAAGSDVAIHNYGSGSWIINNNCYGTLATAGTPGVGTNSVVGNPLFVNTTTKDFHLQAGSPCIDKGVYVNVTKDFDGINIPQGAAPDIGAYEFI